MQQKFVTLPHIKATSEDHFLATHSFFESKKLTIKRTQIEGTRLEPLITPGV